MDAHTITPGQAADKPLRGRQSDPAFRHARAVKAGQASVTLDAYIDRIVRRAGQLNSEQIARLRALLPPVETQ